METTAWKPESFDILDDSARRIARWLYIHWGDEEVQRIWPRIVGRGYRRADVEAALQGVGDLHPRLRLDILLLAAHNRGYSITEIVQRYVKARFCGTFGTHALPDRKKQQLYAICKALQNEAKCLSATQVH